MEKTLMHDLVVVKFPNKNTASAALESCLQLAYDGHIDLFDAVAAHRTEDGRLRIDGSVQPTPREEGTWGAVFGGFLGAIVAGAFTAGAGFVPAVAAAAVGGVGAGAIGADAGADSAEQAKKKHGLSEDFVTRVAGTIQPGDSALFALFDARRVERALEMFRGYGGTIIKTSLSPDRAERLQTALDTLDA
jgi:uncharacterized membrane protein